MSRRRLVLPAASRPRSAVLAAVVRAASSPGARPQPTAGRSPDAATRPGRRCRRSADEAAPVPPAEAGRCGSHPRSFNDNGRRSRFATPGGRNEAGSARDLTPRSSGRSSRRAWLRSSRGAISGRSGAGVVTVRAALEGQTAAGRRSHARAAVGPLLGFRRGHRARSSPGWAATPAAATARPTARTASISRSSATTRPAIFRPWRATAASAGCRGWLPRRACSSPRRRTGRRTAAGRG